MSFKKLNDFFWPFNIFGQNKKSISYDVPGSTISIHVSWTGDKLMLIYCNESDTGEIVETRFTEEGGGTFIQIVKNGFNFQIPQNKIFFNCTNVTSLIVNGQQLI